MKTHSTIFGSLLFLGLSSFATDSIYSITSKAAYSPSKYNNFSTPECIQFKQFAHDRKIDKTSENGKYAKLKPFNTDAITIVKNGQILYEWYDGIYKPDTPHVLWSASKMLTTTLIGRTIFEHKKYTYINADGQSEEIEFSLDLPVSIFFPNPPLLKDKELNKKYPNLAQHYSKLTIRNLVEMSANFVWNEFYDEDMTNSTFIPMLYGSGRKKMYEYFLSQPISTEGPGNRWNYSGGNSNLLQAILAKVWGEKFNYPQELLFKPLTIQSAVWERDNTGHFIGSSYAYLPALEYAKIGQLFLNKGKWPKSDSSNSWTQLLSDEWVKSAQELTPSISLPATPLEYIKKLGAQSRRVFWLNKDIFRDGKLLYGQEMPKAPSDMYFAAGHYGQILIIIPSENLIISRTGSDPKYWDHIEPLTTKTLKCLNSVQQNARSL